MMFEFGEYCFIKWKFKFWNFLSENSKYSIFYWWSFGSIDWNGKEKIMESLDVSIAARFLFNRSKRALDQSKVTFDRSKIVKQDFSAEFSGDYSESLKSFQALWTVLWNILTFHTCFLMKYNPIGINRDLCSLEK